MNKTSKILCACGCGLSPKQGQDFVIGHRQIGTDNWDKRYTKPQTSKNRTTYPTHHEIIGTHHSFLKAQGLDPNKCWGCQLRGWEEKAHIHSVSSGGNNSPENLLLLCTTCHIFQGWNDFNYENVLWDLEAAYNWLTNWKCFWFKQICIEFFITREYTLVYMGYEKEMKNQFHVNKGDEEWLQKQLQNPNVGQMFSFSTNFYTKYQNELTEAKEHI